MRVASKPGRLHLDARVVRFAAASLVVGFATVSVAVIPAQVAVAATDTVSTCSGSGPGSLPVVAAAAASGDTINFSVTCPPGSPIVLSSTIDIGTNLTISGPGASSLAVSGGGSANEFSVFQVGSTVTDATISGLTIEDGYSLLNNLGVPGGGGIFNYGTLTVNNSTLSGNSANPDNGGGGAIENDGGTLTVADSTVSGNSASDGGGIYANGGTLNVTDSTVSGNSASDGGGIYANAGTLNVTDSTLSGNTVSRQGGGIFNFGVLTVTSSTLSGNSANATNGGGGILQDGSSSVTTTIVANSPSGGDCFGSITDAGYNVDDDGSCGFSSTNHSQSGVDAGLGLLQNNGGPTQTIALEPGSPAVGAVTSTSLCSSTDQRGVARTTPCDIGAVELVLVTPDAITSANSGSDAVAAPFSFRVTTIGFPVPSITKTGKLPKHVKLVNNGNGTATISGTPTKTGTYHFTLKATFGKGKTKHVVPQAFTLTVTP